MKAALLFRNPAKAQPYEHALELAGLEPVPFTPGSAHTLDSVGGIVLTGGTDVDPSLYGAAPHPETSEPDRERDDYESSLLREAIRRGMPVLAICRGMQLLNVIFGGTLLQDIPNHRDTEHEVDLGPPLAALYGTDRITVNSRHHQAVAGLGAGLAVAARDPADGIVEGIALTGQPFVVGVQWHPEDMIGDPYQRLLFETFRKFF